MTGERNWQVYPKSGICLDVRYTSLNPNDKKWVRFYYKGLRGMGHSRDDARYFTNSKIDCIASGR